VGVVAFEVTEAVDPAFAQQLGDQERLGRVFREEYERLPQAKRLSLEQRLGDAIVHVEFHEDATVRRRRSVVPRVLDALGRLPPQFEGEVPIQREWNLEGLVTWIGIGRGSFIGPSFDVSRVVPVENQLVPRLRDKFGKSYQTNARRVELLVYYYVPMPWAGEWVPRVKAVLADEMPRSLFDRVWLFAAGARRVDLVYSESGISSAS
jgi:hypothetical protein